MRVCSKGKAAMTRWIATLLALAVAGCAPGPLALAPTGAAVQAADTPVAPAERRAFFGELHLHTSYSFDAWGLMGTKIGPDEALRFGKGEAVTYQGKSI